METSGEGCCACEVVSCMARVAERCTTCGDGYCSRHAAMNLERLCAHPQCTQPTLAFVCNLCMIETRASKRCDCEHCTWCGKWLSNDAPLTQQASFVEERGEWVCMDEKCVLQQCEQEFDYLAASSDTE